MPTKDEKYAAKLAKLLKRWGVENEEDIKDFVEDAVKLVNDESEEDVEPSIEEEKEPMEEEKPEEQPKEEEIVEPKVEEEKVEIEKEEEKTPDNIETVEHQENVQKTLDGLTSRIDALEDLITKLADSKQESFGLKGANQGETKQEISFQDRINRMRKGY